MTPHVLTAVAPLVSPAGGRPMQNLPQRKQPVIVPPVVASASAALRRGSMPSIPGAGSERASIPIGERATIPEPKLRPATEAGRGASTARDSVHDDPPTKQMTPQQAASLSRRARTASRTKGLMSLSHGGAQQKERTRTKTERGERSAKEIDSAAPEPTPSAARTLKRAVAESTDEMPAPPPDVIAAAAASAGARRPRREDEITVVRPPFPKPDASRAAELATLAGSFDDEQTNVLGGDESFVDLGAQKSSRGAAAPEDRVAIAPEPAGTQPSREEHGAERWSSFRVGVVQDASGAVRLVDAKDGAAVAFLVPSDAKSAEAIASWLHSKTWPKA